ncbi:hypothetical protein Tco_1290191 [Tanacetum coccineum]
MATGIKSYGTRSKEPIRVVEPHVVEDYDDTEVPNTSSSKATSKAPSKVPCKILESQPPSKPETPTLEDCQNKLKVLGWLEDDPLYDVALAIFCEPSYRYREG